MTYLLFPSLLALAILQVSFFPHLPFGLNLFNPLLLILIVVAFLRPALAFSLAFFVGLLLESYSSRLLFLTTFSFLAPVVAVALTRRFFSSIVLPGFLPPLPFLILALASLTPLQGLMLQNPSFVFAGLFAEIAWGSVALVVGYFMWRLYGIFQGRYLFSR